MEEGVPFWLDEKKKFSSTETHYFILEDVRNIILE